MVMQASSGVDARTQDHQSKVVLTHLDVCLSDIELLTDGTESSNRSSTTYTSAYKTLSLPIKLPITSDQPTDAPDAPLILDSKAKAHKKKSTNSGKGRSVPKSLADAQQTLLLLFASANARAAPNLPPKAASKCLNDVVFNVGGPVWALDWCPAHADEDGEETATQYLAVGVHGRGREWNNVGRRIQGCGILQIWELQHRPAEGADKAALPRLAIGLCHDHGIVWDAKWCPSAYAGDAGSSNAALKRLGLLAVLYGDGELHVLAVPRPESLAELGASDSHTGDGGEGGEASDSSNKRIYIRLKPKAAAPADALNSSLGSCLEWLQVPPHDLLLVGCWDGSVAVWRIPPEQPGSASARSSSSPVPLQLQLLSHIMADTVAIRSVAWAPVEAAGESSDLSSRHIFLTAGHSSLVKFWDARDPFQPLFEVPAQISWILSALWVHQPSGVLLCQEDGAFRWLSLQPQDRPAHEQRIQTTWWGISTGTLWTCHISPFSDHAAYAGDGGEVVVACPDFQHRLRRKLLHIVISSTSHQNDVICIGGQRAPQEPVGTRANPLKGKVTDPEAAIYKVRWGCAQAVDPQATWIASGGANGIVHCQRISYYVTSDR